MKQCGLQLPKSTITDYSLVPINDEDSIQIKEDGEVQYRLDYSIQEMAKKVQRTARQFYRFYKACLKCRQRHVEPDGHSICLKNEPTFELRFYGFFRG